MDIQIILMLVTLGASILLFSYEWLAADVTALAILLFLILTGLLPLDVAFDGFGSDVFVMMFGLLIMTASLTRTGVTRYAGLALLRWTGSAPLNRLLPVLMGVAVTTSAFISNTASTALLLPIVTDLARQSRVSLSKVLMPLAVAAISASSLTLIGTSTNIVMSGLMTQSGLEPIGMFELTPVGIPIAVISLLYMWLVGHRLIPERAPVHPPEEEYSQRLFLSEIRLSVDSDLVGQTLAETALGQRFDLNVLRIIRDERRTIIPRASTRLEAGDVLLVEGDRDHLLRIKSRPGLDIEAEVKLAFDDIETDQIGLSEVILLPGSPLLGRTLKAANVRHHYDVQVLAINRHGQTLTRKMADVRLRSGDILLVQSTQQQLMALQQQKLFQLLGPVERGRPERIYGSLAVAIFAGVVLVSALNLLTLPVAMLLGAALVLITGCITPQEAYQDIQWTALIVIACMLGLGAAMVSTGTAAFLADQIAQVLVASSPMWLLAAFFFLTVLLTQPMSNQAAAAVVFPVALQAAHQLDLNPRCFAMMIALAASCSFITPLEPASLMVYGPGQYRFSDFTKVGFPLTILIFVIAIVIVPRLWPLHL